MPKSFLVKKKHGICGAWQWKEPENYEWKEDNLVGKKKILLIMNTVICQINLGVFKSSTE